MITIRDDSCYNLCYFHMKFVIINRAVKDKNSSCNNNFKKNNNNNNMIINNSDNNNNNNNLKSLI